MKDSRAFVASERCCICKPVKGQQSVSPIVLMEIFLIPILIWVLIIIGFSAYVKRQNKKILQEAELNEQLL